MNLSPRRRLIGLIALWAVSLAGLAFFWPDGGPTVREQVGAGVSRPVAAAAVAAAVAEASTYEDAAFTVGGFVKGADCSLTPIRSGVAYSQTVTVYTRPENAYSLLGRLYTALKAPYDLVGNGEGAYLGSAGPFVVARLEQGDDGAVTWTLDTGCRPDEDPVAQVEAVGTPGPTAAAVATSLGMTAPRWTQAEGGCGTGGSSGAASTVSASSMPASGEAKGAEQNPAGVTVTAETVTRAAESGWVAYSGPAAGAGAAVTEAGARWFVGMPDADGSVAVLSWDPVTGVATVSSTVACG
ncbi:hypothetical protein AB0I28_22970 [Phytomonospora sp. NPDC050363]|uniref:hypothetical protein n=1 Tax=Phytomonospora sp. NPDC050363 TaxID=3155642 RepID=UPI0033DF327C